MNDWRARGERAAARPRSVGAVVNAVRASLRVTRAVECALFFLGGAWLARSATLLSDSTQGVGLLMALCGALCAAAWWLEHPVERHATARALDRRLRHHGALTTAYEIEERRGGARASALTPMEELVRMRVLERLRLADAFRALFPPLFLPIGAPLAAGLILLFVLEVRRAPSPSTPDARALLAGLELTLAGTELEPEAAEGSRAEAELARLRAEVGDLVASLPRPAEGRVQPEAELGAARARLLAIDRSLSELLARAEPEAALHGRLEEARGWLDALRTGLGESADAPPAPALDGTEPGSGTAPGARGTISPPSPVQKPMPSASPASLLAAPATAPDTVPESPLGVQAGNAWPREYDAVVERWIELSRAARAGERTPDERR